MKIKPIMHQPDSIERAFELATSGTLESIGQIQRQLTREGYDASRIAGRILVGQLNKLTEKRDACWKAYLRSKAHASL